MSFEAKLRIGYRELSFEAKLRMEYRELSFEAKLRMEYRDLSFEAKLRIGYRKLSFEPEKYKIINNVLLQRNVFIFNIIILHVFLLLYIDVYTIILCIIQKIYIRK